MASNKSEINFGELSEEVDFAKRNQEEREKANHNAKVEFVFTCVWVACLAAKIWWLK